LWAATLSGVRASIGGLIRSVIHWRISLLILLLIVYLVGIIYLLQIVGFWTEGILKGTILWFLFSGLALIFSTLEKDSDDGKWKQIAISQLKIIVLFEFIVNTYTFSFLVELVLIPLLAFIGVLDVIAKSNARHARVGKITEGLQAIVGIAILAFAIIKAINTPEVLMKIDAFRSILLGPLLSILFIPTAYFLMLLTRYEMLFVRLKIGRQKDRQLRWYAMRKLVIYLGLNPKKVRIFDRSFGMQLMRMASKGDVDELLIAAERSRYLGGDWPVTSPYPRIGGG